MKLSIRLKLFLWIAALAVLFVLISFLLNTTLFKPYYMERQRKSFLSLCEELSLLYENDKKDFLDEVRSREYREGFMIGLYSLEVGLLTSGEQAPAAPAPEPNRPFQLNERPPYPVPEHIIREMIQIGEGEKYDFREMKHTNELTMLSMFYRLDDEMFLLASRPMESIDESIAIAGRFTFFTGLVLLLIGTAAAFLMSKFITDPVNELKSIAESMSGLDFSRKYTIRSNDEIGELGQSINSLSDQLNNAIERLNKLNTSLLLEIEKERKIDEMRQNFIASVSHELRTPISLIEGYAEGLIDNIADNRKKRESYCQVIMDETKKMEKHVRDLLTLSQLQSGVIPLEYSRFDINGLISRVIGNFENMADSDGYSFLFTPSPPLFVRADRNKTEQVISNYLKNALRHGSGNKEISLRSEERSGEKIRVTVYNSGDPITEENLERIWESYYKVDKARTRQHGGCGLGLSIVKAILAQHKNRCGVENRPGGVSFWFELDRDDPEKA